MFTSWLMIAISGLAMFYAYNILAVTIMVLSQALFFGGLCAHSFISAVFLAGLFVSTASQAAAAGYTWFLGKSRRLKRNTNIFILLGFGIYIGIFVLLWDFLDKTHSLTYREFFFWAWMISYLPFSFYFPYALILFVLPEQQDQSDYILSAIKLWTEFLDLVPRVAIHWKEQAYDGKKHNTHYEF